MIHLSKSAAQEIKRLQTSRQKSGSYFRIGIQPGGCSGFYYTLDLCEAIQDGDLVYHSQEISILVDEASYPYLKELRLDFAEDLMGGSFRFQNPNAASTCGCTLSFAYAAETSNIVYSI
jgi:iron-sulfur cluster assembly accessory protein